MKIKEKTKKNFDTVKMMREIRDKIDNETKGMSFEELKKYFENSRLKLKKVVSS